MDNKKLSVEPKDYTLSHLKQMYDKGKLIVNPDYQRQYVYNDSQASRLVESIIMNIPIPTVYLCEEPNGKYSIIDGQQRIVSFKRFLNNEFSLKDLTVYPNLNGKFYKNLNESLQSKVEEYALRTIVITQESADMKYDIFARLNQGAVKLNQQELRNCIYRGSLNNLIKELAKNETFGKLYGSNNNRMVYEETILRFFALRDYPNYRGSMMGTMNKYMQLHQNEEEKEISKFKSLFIKTIDSIIQIVGINAFCGVNRDTKEITSKFSGAVYDSIIIPFSMFDKNKLFKYADDIRKEINRIKTSDDQYLNDFTYAATGSRDRVIGRITLIYNAISKITGKDALLEEKRNFETRLKTSLFEKSNKCAICGNEILRVEDAELDHIVPFSRGGLTNEANVQLVHRGCNRIKSAGETAGNDFDGQSGHLLTFWEFYHERVGREEQFKSSRERVLKPSYDYSISIGIRGLSLATTLMTKDHQIRLSFYIYKDLDLFYSLKDHQSEIESYFGEDLAWEITDNDISRISYYVDNFDLYEPIKYKKLADKCISKLIKIYNAISPFVK